MYDMQTKPKTNLSNDKKQETSKTVKPRRKIDFHKPARSNSVHFFEHKKSQQNTYGSSIIQEKPNRTGLPDSLKNGIESLSGYSMDDVKVHYNSSDPAQLGSLAYARGNEIYVAPGQERHLGHEAWHIVQQKQGRVAPTMQMNSININNDDALEREADIMGAKAIQMKAPANTVNLKYVKPVSCVQRERGDLICKATVRFISGGKDAEAEGFNGQYDFNLVKDIFADYKLTELARLPKATNEPGVCAEAQALANALYQSKRWDDLIKRMTVTKAVYTDNCKNRIIGQINNGSIHKCSDDKNIANIMLGQLNKPLNIDSLLKKPYLKAKTCDEIKNTVLTRNPCKTCQEWIDIDKVVDGAYQVKDKFLPKQTPKNEKSETDNGISTSLAELLNITEELLNTEKGIKDLLSSKKEEKEAESEEDESNDASETLNKPEELKELKNLKNHLEMQAFNELQELTNKLAEFQFENEELKVPDQETYYLGYIFEKLNKILMSDQSFLHEIVGHENASRFLQNYENLLNEI